VVVLFTFKTYAMYDKNRIQYNVITYKRIGEKVVEEGAKTR